MTTKASHWAPVRHLDFGHSIAELEDHVSKLVAFVTDIRASKERRLFSCEHYGTRYSVDTSGTRLKPLARAWTPRGLPAASKPKRARPAPKVNPDIPQTSAEKCWRVFSSTPVKAALLRLLAETCHLPEADAVVRATRLLNPQDAGWPVTVPPPDGQMHENARCMQRLVGLLWSQVKKPDKFPCNSARIAENGRINAQLAATAASLEADPAAVASVQCVADVVRRLKQE
jgi:hypothetical protein